MTAIHDSLIFIDGLVISKWSRPVFADMRKGGLTAANALLNLAGVCRDDARHRAMETLVHRECRFDHSSALWSILSP